MTERKMTKKQIVKAIKDVVEYHVEFYIGTAGISVLNGSIITKINNTIFELGLSEKAETRCCKNGEWVIIRKYH